MRARSSSAVRRSPLSLTAELVSRVERKEPDPGPLPGRVYLTEPEYDALATDLIAAHGGGPFWIFAYGSLIWKPECAFTEHRRATAHGWHRSFCLELKRWRGTPDCPGLMMALDHGGACHGVICRLPDEDPFAQLNKLLHREVDQREDIGTLRWITASADIGKVRALTFYAGAPGELLHRQAARCGGCQDPGAGGRPLGLLRQLSLPDRHQARGCGIHDTHLWKLQKMVAEEIRKLG